MVAPGALCASIVSAIKSSISSNYIALGQSGHALALKSGHLPVLSNLILNLYCKSAASTSSSLRDADKLFAEMSRKDLVTFSTLISARSHSGDPDSALLLAVDLQELGLAPNQYVLSSLIVACSRAGAVDLGRQVHAQAVASDLDSDPFVKASLVDMYSKVGELGTAFSALNRGPAWDSVMLNSMISGYVASHHHVEAIKFFGEMRRSFDFEPTEFTFGILIKACGYLEREVGETLHGFTLKIGLDSNCFIGTSLVDIYGRLGDTESLELVFMSVLFADLALYNATMVGLSQNDQHDISLRYFRELMFTGYYPNECTYSAILKACGGMRSLSLGMALHGLVMKSKFNKDLVVNTAVIDMYMKCGITEQGLRVFDQMDRRNIVSYNSVMFGLGLNERHNEALGFFIEMNRLKLDPDLATFIALAGSCFGHTWSAYVHAIKHGFGEDPIVENSLLCGLVQNGAFEGAFEFFHNMKERSVISWTTVISGLAQAGLHHKAINYFVKMILTTVRPNRFTFSSALKACSGLASLLHGRCIHGFGIKLGIVDGAVMSSLLDMYAKCGSLHESLRLFEEVPKRDIVSWNSMITAYSQHGYGHKSIELFDSMELSGMEPNSATFFSLLAACSHCGLVEDGVRLFELMYSRYNISPLPEHCACIVDMFGRAGMLETAKDFIESMLSTADSSIWAVFLSCCNLKGNIGFALLAKENLMRKAEADYPTLTLMSRLYCGAGKWDDAEKMRNKVGFQVFKKEPGISRLLSDRG